MGSGRKKKDNRGMSLVELIIVIAIMGAVIGVTGYGLTLVSKKPVDECAKKIEMALNQNRTNAMGSTEAYVAFYLNDKNRVTIKQHFLNSARGSGSSPRDTITVIGANGVGVRLYAGEGTPPVDLQVVTDADATDNMRKIGFRRDSGSVIGIDSENKVYTKIEVYKGTYVKTIKIDPLTGKVKLQ